MLIEIPANLSEVSLELCRRVFVDICGGTVKLNATSDDNPYTLFDHKGHYVSKGFYPFTRIQDTKLCDPFLWKHDLLLEVLISNECHASIKHYYDELDKVYLDCRCLNESEPFARTCAILKAANKIGGEGE